MRSASPSGPFRQFVPASPERPQPGDFGWGFMHGRYRVVMYGPPAFDTREASSSHMRRSSEARRRNGLDWESLEETGYADRISRRSYQREERKRHRPRRGEEHGPAHIHVIRLSEEGLTEAETRFELFEHAEGKHFLRPFITKAAGRADPVSLASGEINALSEELQPYTSAFIEMWRDFYKDTRLGHYVSRVVHCGGHERIRRELPCGGYSLNEMDESDKIVFPAEEPHRLIDRHRREDGFYHTGTGR